MSIYYLYPPPSRYPTTSIRGHAFPTTAAVGSHSHPHHNPLQPLLHVLHDLAHPAAAAHDVRAPVVDIRETVARYYIDVELPGVAPGDYSVRWIDEESGSGGGGGKLLLVEAELQRRRLPEEEEEEEEEEENRKGEGKEGEGGIEEDMGSPLQRMRSHDGDELYAAESSGSDEEHAAVPPVTPAKKARTQSLSAAWTAAAARPRAFLLHHAATAPGCQPEAVSSASSSSPSHPSTSPPKSQQHAPDANPRVRSLARERRVGTFARAFRFQAGVDRAGLRAHLDQGVLSLVVPKMRTEEGKEEEIAAVTKTTSKGAGVDSVPVRRRRTTPAAAPGHKEQPAGGSGRRGSFLHGAHHWTLAWPGPARNRVVGPRDWSPGLMNSPGLFM